MKNCFLSAVFAIIMVCCTSCFGLEPTKPQPISVISGIYILNNGSWGGNNANIVTYNYDKYVGEDIFFKANNKNLGELGQDILIHGGKMYIAVSGSGVVFVTDLSGKILGEVRAGEKGTCQPRALAAGKGNVFISYYEGYVGRIDTVNFKLTLSDNVGPNPEGIAFADDKVYTAISNGLNYPDYDSTVVVIDPTSLVVKERLTVGVNPSKMVSCGDIIYCMCSGNYSDIPAQVNVLFCDDDENYFSSKCPFISNPVQNCIASDNHRYVFVAEKMGTNFRIKVIDCATGLLSDDSFIKDGTIFKNGISSLDIDPLNYALFVGTSDYVNNGDMYVFTRDGERYDKFDTGGINPIKVVFSTTSKTIK